MKTKVFSVIAVAAGMMMCANAFASSPLSRGTAVAVRITSQITSKTVGSPTAIVEADIKGKDGNVLISRGTPVMLQIDNRKARSCGKEGTLAVRCISTTAVDGQSIMLDGSYAAEGENKEGLAIGLGVGLGLTVLPGVGFAFLAIKGEDAKIPVNTVIPAAFVMNDYTIEIE